MKDNRKPILTEFPVRPSVRTFILAATWIFPAAHQRLCFYFRKHDRQSTDLPCVGLNGTVVSAPHAEHIVLVSERAFGPPLVRLALHGLQRRGSFLNSLSWKNNCSPAVNTNSAEQSLHFNTLSESIKGGFPN